MTATPPVVAPVAPPARTPRWGILAATLLALFVLGFAVHAAWLWKPADRSDPRRFAPAKEPRFGPGTRPRAEALRDRLVRGLLSLRLKDGSFSPQPSNPDVEAVARTEATAMAVAGLAAGRWTGSKVDGLDAAIARAKAAVLAKQARNGEFGAPSRPNRAAVVSTLSSAILALALAGDAADGPALEEAGKALVAEMVLGPVQEPWSRGSGAIAALALAGTGHGRVLGGGAKSVIAAGDLPKVRDAGDARVVEALVRRARRDDAETDPYPAEILAKCLEAGAKWGGDRTDLYSWTLRAWLASRTPGGDSWFALVLPALEKAPGDAGTVLGDFYGDPVSRTACALLVLLEGWTPQLPFGG